MTINQNDILEFNTIIIGGGIVGAGIFRDLSLHQIPTLLVDKADFTSKTSQSSSKMLHGGIRYLENYDFDLVKEALHEKNLWLKIAPHLCYEERFYIPVFKDSKRPLWMIKAGLFLYDLLSGFNNTLHDTKNKSETIKDISNLKSTDLCGSGIYSDAIVDDAKMTLEMIYDGLLFKQSEAFNYHEFQTEEKLGEYHIVKIKNLITNEIKIIKVKNIIYALGPYTDTVLSKQKKYHWKNQLLPSKGSHLWIKNDKLNLKHPLVMMSKDDRVIFVIPQKGMVLVGTTEIKTKPDELEVEISKTEIEYLLNELNKYFPKSKIDESDILGHYSGIRPLVKEDGDDLGKTSREHKIVQIKHNIFAILGGKYTTFRVMGQEIVRNIVIREQKAYDAEKTMTPLQKLSTIRSFSNTLPSKEQLKAIIQNELPLTYEDLLVRRIGINNVMAEKILLTANLKMHELINLEDAYRLNFETTFSSK